MTTVNRKRQEGVTLVVGLIMLVLLTLMAISAFNLGKGNLQIVGNMQNRGESYNAAQQALEEALSTVRLFSAPTAVFLTPCTTQNTKCYSINASGNNDIVVKVGSSEDPAQPRCVRAMVVPVAQLNLSNPDDLGCTVGQGQTFGIAGAATGNSLCGDTVWDVKADAQDSVTSTRVVSYAGVKVRVSANTITTSCP
jgi:Tfp pilus assembly protein PilX